MTSVRVRAEKLAEPLDRSRPARPPEMLAAAPGADRLGLLQSARASQGTASACEMGPAWKPPPALVPVLRDMPLCKVGARTRSPPFFANVVHAGKEHIRSQLRLQSHPRISRAEEAGGLRRLIQENVDNTLRSVAVPLVGNSTRASLAIENRIRLLHDGLRVDSDEHVGSDLAGNRALGVGAHREAGHAQYGRLLLNTSAVRENHAGARD